MNTPHTPKERAHERAPLPHHGKSLDKIKKFGWQMLDDIGVLTYLNKDILQVDTSYQREVSKSRALQLSQAWSWIACNTITVAEREPGQFFVIDGQTRLDAARRRSDIEEMPCSVFQSSGPEEEAAAFVRLNCVRGHVLVFDRWKAELKANNLTVVAAEQLMQSCGYHRAKGDEQYGLRSLGCFLNYFERDRDLFSKVFPIIAQLHNGMPIRDDMINALMYVAKYGDTDITAHGWRERIVSGIGYDRIRHEIDRARSLYARGGAKVFALGALQALNKGLRANSRIILSTEEKTDDQ